MDNECPLVYFSLLLFGGALEPVIPNMLFALNSFSSVCSGPVDAVGFFFCSFSCLVVDLSLERFLTHGLPPSSRLHLDFFPAHS